MLEYAPVLGIVRRGISKTRSCDCKIFVLFHEKKFWTLHEILSNPVNTRFLAICLRCRTVSKFPIFQNACITVTVFLHYLWLVVFMWMLIEGISLFLKVNPNITVKMKLSICMPVAWGKIKTFVYFLLSFGTFQIKKVVCI